MPPTRPSAGVCSISSSTERRDRWAAITSEPYSSKLLASHSSARFSRAVTRRSSRGGLHEVGVVVEGLEQAVAVEAERHEDHAVDAEVLVPLDAVAIGALEVRAHAHFDVVAGAALRLEGAVEAFECFG